MRELPSKFVFGFIQRMGKSDSLVGQMGRKREIDVKIGTVCSLIEGCTEKEHDVHREVVLG